MVAALKEFSIKHASSDAKNEGARLLQKEIIIIKKRQSIPNELVL